MTSLHLALSAAEKLGRLLELPRTVRSLAVINAAFDARHKPVQYSFAEARSSDWAPFCDRFERRRWMQWPEVTGRNPKASKVAIKAAYGEEPDNA